jgi:hypothetical protein
MVRDGAQAVGVALKVARMSRELLAFKTSDNSSPCAIAWGISARIILMPKVIEQRIPDDVLALSLPEVAREPYLQAIEAMKSLNDLMPGTPEWQAAFRNALALKEVFDHLMAKIGADREALTAKVMH